jgi:hypothetical protein
LQRQNARNWQRQDCDIGQYIHYSIRNPEPIGVNAFCVDSFIPPTSNRNTLPDGGGHAADAKRGYDAHEGAGGNDEAASNKYAQIKQDDIILLNHTAAL